MNWTWSYGRKIPSTRWWRLHRDWQERATRAWSCGRVALATIGYTELNKSGAFLVPGFAKFVVIKKPATKERSGINPFTKEPTIFKAKPARKIIRARPVKAAKDAVS